MFKVEGQQNICLKNVGKRNLAVMMPNFPVFFWKWHLGAGVFKKTIQLLSSSMDFSFPSHNRADIFQILTRRLAEVAKTLVSSWSINACDFKSKHDHPLWFLNLLYNGTHPRLHVGHAGNQKLLFICWTQNDTLHETKLYIVFTLWKGRWIINPAPPTCKEEKKSL